MYDKYELLEILTKMSFILLNATNERGHFIHLNTVHLFGISIIPIFNQIHPKSGCKIVISVEPMNPLCSKYPDGKSSQFCNIILRKRSVNSGFIYLCSQMVVS